MVSSAKNDVITFSIFGKSLLYREYSIGERQDPRGKPAAKGLRVNSWS